MISLASLHQISRAEYPKRHELWGNITLHIADVRINSGEKAGCTSVPEPTGDMIISLRLHVIVDSKALRWSC